MLNLLKDKLHSKGALSGPLHPIIDRVTESIPYQTIHQRMKQTIAVSEAMLFASQFRRNIHHWDGGTVPINYVSFIITGSGGHKDSSVNAARKCFNVGYDMINTKRKELAKKRAIQEASAAGEDMPYEWESHKRYYRAPNPLFTAPSTVEGFIQHLNDLDEDGLGAGNIYAGEFATELATSQLMSDTLKLLSELYDLGNKEVKVLKARENQSKEIKGLPVSAMFVTSPVQILYDESLKRKFRTEFSTKLARRSWFCFLPKPIPEPTYSSVDELIQAELTIEDSAIIAREKISAGVTKFTEYHLAHAGKLLEVDPEVRELFIIYKRYNTEVAAALPRTHPISELVRKHLQWKALKLAGALAMYDLSETVTADHYIQAIRFCELLDKDMQLFESELVKEQYEVFADYIQSLAENGKASLSLHALRKLGYIPMSGSPEAKLKELVQLAASYDQQGVYTVVDANRIDYEAIIPTDSIGVSYLAVDNSEVSSLSSAGADKDVVNAAKQRVAYTATSGYQYNLTDFASLANLLSKDYAYSPFQFKDGQRGKDNITSGTKWLVFDVDNSVITADEAHFILQDINHHIALSSNANNKFKFRVLVELDSVVDLKANEWKYFYNSVAKSLQLNVDQLPQSQIFYSYAGRQVLSVTDKSKLEVRDHIMLAKDHTLVSKPISEQKLTQAQKKSLLSDPLETFNYAYESSSGAGSRNLIRAAYHARDLGATTEEIIELVQDINNYWEYPMPSDRLEATIISQIKRF